jgi:hypothetical protein
MKSNLEKAREFILGNARLLDRKRFAFRFEGGAAKDVVAALRPYQNVDGGFGHALEPDMRCSASQPVSTELALEILDELGELHQELVQPCCDRLSSVTTNGWSTVRTRERRRGPTRATVTRCTR